ncbi:MAG: DsbA family oxidoreductase [Gammaproteobacteria bacterium]
MATPMKIDFVSDVSCPWCIIGLKALEQAVEKIGDDIAVDVHFQPFELNPEMAPEGQDLFEHMAQKYGASTEQSERTREMIRARGEDLGFTFRMDKLERIYNTFDTHRLLHYAALEGCQSELKHALFGAYFTNGENPGDHDILIRLAEQIGLDVTRAREILASDAFAKDVRKQQKFYQDQGIQAVPAVIINGRHLINGGQPVEVFEQALRQIAEE